MSGLIDKITSDFFEAQNALNKSKGIVIEVYVENEDDIPFWKRFLIDATCKQKYIPLQKHH
jgi:hypothetical protein